MKITYENGWEYTDIHVDLPVPYEDNYQMRMLRANQLPGLAALKGSGLDGNSRYTYRVSGVSIGKKFETVEMKKADIRGLLDALMRTAETLAAHMLSPDGLLLTPELIYTRGGNYEFCYLPVSEEQYRVPLCRSFHALTEYFVGRLDYQDTEGVFLVCRLHRETMNEGYELRRILEECRREESEYRRETALREKKQYQCEELKKENTAETLPVPDVPEKKGFVKRAVSRFCSGRWGEWKDLITEMDDEGV